MSRADTRRSIDWKAVVGLGLSGVLLYFALRDVDPAVVVHEIRRADPVPYLGSIALATFLFVIRAARWRPLLQSVVRGTGFRSRFAATTIGFMANNLLPARVGEFARAYALSRFEPVPMSASFASIVVERLFDGLTIVGLFFFAVALPSFPALPMIAGQDLESAALVLLGVFLAGAAVLVIMVLWPDRAVHWFESTVARLLPRSFRRPVVDALEAFLDGLAVLRTPSLLVRVAAWSVVHWLVGAIAYWLVLRAFDISVPFAAAIFLQSLIALAVAVPAAPGFFGVYEASARLGLGVWGVEAEKAVSMAIGFHIGSFIPVTLIGLYYVWRMGLGWDEIGRSEEVVESAVESEAPDAETTDERP